MRDHKAHPADHTADGDTSRRHERCAQNHNDTQPSRMHAHASGLCLTHGKKIHAPPEQPQRNQPRKNRPRGKLHVARLCRGQRAHQPVGDGGQLIGRIGNQFNKGGAGGKKRADHHAREHHRKRRLDFAHARNEIRKQNREQAKGERQPRHRAIAKTQQKRQCRAESRAGRRAKKVRRDHGVSEHALIGAARRRKRSPDQSCRRHAREPYVQNDRLRSDLPRLHEREISPAERAQQPVRQNPERLQGGNIVPTHPERAEKHQCEQKRQNQKSYSCAMRFFHALPSIIF